MDARKIERVVLPNDKETYPCPRTSSQRLKPGRAAGMTDPEEPYRPSVSRLITDAFLEARSRYWSLEQSWIQISVRVGGLLPDSVLMPSIQAGGQLDLLLRCMEDEHATAGETQPMLALHYRRIFSEAWIGVMYAIFEVLADRKVITDTGFLALEHDLRILRVAMHDPLRTHIIPVDASERGSITWQVIDIRNDESRWIERRELSDRIVRLWAKAPGRR
jgi:hypothetical protein